MISKTKVN